MTENSNSQTQTVAYASMVISIDALSSLTDYCVFLDQEVDIYAEEAHPEDFKRPMFQMVLDKIQKNEVKTLIVPSLYHLAGDDTALLNKILNLTKRNHVELITLSNLKNNSALYTANLGGAQ